MWAGLRYAGPRLRWPRDWDPAVVLITAACLFSVGVYLRLSVPPERATEGLGGAVVARLPAGWVAEDYEGVFTVERPTLGAIPTRIEMRWLEDVGESDVDLLLARVGQTRSATGAAFRTLSVEERRVFGGYEGVAVRSALVRDPPDSRPGDAVMPVVVVAVDVLVRRGDRYLWVGGSSARDRQPELDRVLAQVRVRP